MKGRLQALTLAVVALAVASPALAQRRGGVRAPSHAIVHAPRPMRVYRPRTNVRAYRSPTNVRVYDNHRVYTTRTPSVVVRPYRPSEWQSAHPHWRERYYYRGGRYFYDPVYRYPAAIDDEWGGIAALSGAAALLGALDHDPTLTFAGREGALYPCAQYESDLHSVDGHARLRAAYFSHSHFWRNGVRYDRVTVTRDGQRYYRFRRR